MRFATLFSGRLGNLASDLGLDFLYRASEVGVAGSGDPAFSRLKAACPHAALFLPRSIMSLILTMRSLKHGWGERCYA